eukprot:1914277-Amphidinium_carterae.1
MATLVPTNGDPTNGDLGAYQSRPWCLPMATLVPTNGDPGAFNEGGSQKLHGAYMKGLTESLVITLIRCKGLRP